jgi:hypothetical protein
LTLKIEAACFSETSVNCQPTPCHIQEDSIKSTEENIYKRGRGKGSNSETMKLHDEELQIIFFLFQTFLNDEMKKDEVGGTRINNER